MSKILGLAALFAAFCAAQAFPPGADRYIATASTTALTVQGAATNGRQILFEQASIFCAAAQTATASWNGTSATATTLAIVKAPNVTATPTATAWSGSNVGAGTTGATYNIPAGGTMLFDMSMIILGTQKVSNFTWTTNGSCTITMQWREQ